MQISVLKLKMAEKSGIISQYLATITGIPFCVFTTSIISHRSKKFNIDICSKVFLLNHQPRTHGMSTNILTMSSGTVIGWPSPVLPRLELPGSHLHITPIEGSWIVSFMSIGAMIGPFPAGYSADIIGRKWTLLGCTIPTLLGWLLITAAQNVTMIYAGRFLGGISIGATLAVCTMYAGEIAEGKIRGSVGSFRNAMVSAGILYVYAIGPYVSYIWLGVISMIVPIVFAVTFIFMPESPYYLMSRDKTEEARKSLYWFRGSGAEEIEKELEIIKDSVAEARQNSGTFRDLFATREATKALYLSCGIYAFVNLNGIHVILSYSTIIFQETGVSFNEDTSTIMVGLVQVLSAFVSPFVVDRLGRRSMLFISATGMCCVEILLGTFFYLKNVHSIDLTFLSWLPVTFLVALVIFHNIGFGSLAPVIISELFPSKVKGIGSAIAASCTSACVFITTIFFQNIVDHLGMHSVFWIFAGACLAADVFVFFLLPETRGKSLEHIQDILKRK